MSQSLDAPPAKRQRLEVAEESILRSDIWHDDGSVVLQAESTQFRIHWGVLSLHSAFFRDMRALPQPVDQPSIEGCPVIELHDSAGDLKHLLHALYNQLLFSDEKLPLPFIAAIVRMGRKYDFQNLLDAAVQRLTHENPMTLDGYELTIQIVQKKQQHVPTKITASRNFAFKMVTLARENNLFAMLPCAYLRILVLYPQETILDGLDGSPVDQRLLISGSKKSIRAQWEQSRFANWLSTHDCADGCTSEVVCATWKRSLFMELVKMSLPFAPFRLFAEQPSSLCSACRRLETVEEARKALWGKLPSFFDLPPWGELKNDI
ncbi:hypothetical protein DFH06DRAFT_1285706 [Mycena polygramma]|nr:hypothetical protein DFH06DRAFT_1285706 [Mycena polygramma]